MTDNKLKNVPFSVGTVISLQSMVITEVIFSLCQDYAHKMSAESVNKIL